MSRFGTERVVKSPNWDADEDVTFAGKLSFMQAHRVNWLRARTAELGTPRSEDELAEQVKLMCTTLQIVLVRWRLRERAPSYEDAQRDGKERKILDMSLDTLVAQPFEDIAYMYRELFQTPATSDESPPATPEEIEERETVITQAAAEEGLTPKSFPHVDADPVHLSRRRRA